MKLATLAALTVLVSGLCFAETYTGKLVDSACMSKNQKTQTTATECTPTVATRSFGIETADGKVLKLDSSGNSKAAAAIKDNSKANMEVTVSGTMQGQTVKVDSLDLR
jgi:hypothetical protein